MKISIKEKQKGGRGLGSLMKEQPIGGAEADETTRNGKKKEKRSEGERFYLHQMWSEAQKKVWIAEEMRSSRGGGGGGGGGGPGSTKTLKSKLLCSPSRRGKVRQAQARSGQTAQNRGGERIGRPAFSVVAQKIRERSRRGTTSRQTFESCNTT